MLMLAVVACATPVASEQAQPPPETLAPESKPPASIEPTSEPALDVAAAGETYLALVAPFNAALCDFGEVAQDPTNGRAQLEPVVELLADASRAFAEGALAETWPADTEAAMQDVVASVASQEASLRGALGSADDASFFANLTRANDERAEGSGAAQLVRITLGLAGIPVSACE